MKWNGSTILFQVTDQLLDAANKQQRIDHVQLNIVPFWWTITRFMWQITTVLRDIRLTIVGWADRFIYSFISGLGNYYDVMTRIGVLVFVLTLLLRAIGFKSRWFSSWRILRWHTILMMFVSIFAFSKGFSVAEHLRLALSQQITDQITKEISFVIPPLGIVSNTAEGVQERQRVMDVVADVNQNGMYEPMELAFAFWRTTPDELKKGTVGAEITSEQGTVILEGMPVRFATFFFPNDGMPWYSGGFTTDPDGAKKRTERVLLANQAATQSRIGTLATFVAVAPEMINFIYTWTHLALVLAFAILVPASFFGEERIWIGQLIWAWVVLFVTHPLINNLFQFWINLWMGKPNQIGIGTTMVGAIFFVLTYALIVFLASYITYRVMKMTYAPIRGRISTALSSNTNAVQEVIEKEGAKEEEIRENLDTQGFYATMPQPTESMVELDATSTYTSSAMNGASDGTMLNALALHTPPHESNTTSSTQQQIVHAVTALNLQQALGYTMTHDQQGNPYSFGHATASAGRYVAWAKQAHVSAPQVEAMVSSLNPDDSHAVSKKQHIFAHTDLSDHQQAEGWRLLEIVAQKIGNQDGMNGSTAGHGSPDGRDGFGAEPVFLHAEQAASLSPIPTAVNADDRDGLGVEAVSPTIADGGNVDALPISTPTGQGSPDGRDGFGAEPVFLHAEQAASLSPIPTAVNADDRDGLGVEAVSITSTQHQHADVQADTHMAMHLGASVPAISTSLNYTNTGDQTITMEQPAEPHRMTDQAGQWLDDKRDQLAATPNSIVSGLSSAADQAGQWLDDKRDQLAAMPNHIETYIEAIRSRVESLESHGVAWVDELPTRIDTTLEKVVDAKIAQLDALPTYVDQIIERVETEVQSVVNQRLTALIQHVDTTMGSPDHSKGDRSIQQKPKAPSVRVRNDDPSIVEPD